METNDLGEGLSWRLRSGGDELTGGGVIWPEPPGGPEEDMVLCCVNPSDAVVFALQYLKLI